MAGSLFLKNGQKTWICLFTCAVYRAIHLELVKSLSTEGFLEALRRFIARRGRPSIIFTDNGTNFTGANNLLRRLNWKKINEFATVKKMEWRFNPPTAAWWGGWWEKLVRSVKEILRKVLGRARLNAEELHTTLCECEAIVNSRPITYVSEDPAQLAPLTPAMFIQDISEVGVPDLDHIDDDKLKARFRYRQKLRVCLRKRFRSEYLGLLSRAKRLRKEPRGIREGEVVIVGDDIHKRIDWPLGLVTKVMHGRDGEIRVVKVKTVHGELIRPVQRLYPLEITTSDAEQALNKSLEKSKEREREILSDEEPPAVQEKEVEIRSRSGRPVRTRQRLDL